LSEQERLDDRLSGAVSDRPHLSRVAPSAWSSSPAWKSNLQPDFNVRVCDRFDARLSAVLRELDESNRFVQKSAESTSM
jgi:hypothetical protein